MADNSKCSRQGCADLAVRHLGNARYCVRHYRFATMRARARRDGKSVPSPAELERLLPLNMVCAPCGRTMNWLSNDGRSTVISLQHDRDGALRLICRACNTRHAHHPGDSFYELRAGERRCSSCRTVKPETDFYKATSGRWNHRMSRCKACMDEATRKRRRENRGRYNAEMRAYRVTQKEQRDAVKQASV